MKNCIKIAAILLTFAFHFSYAQVKHKTTDGKENGSIKQIIIFENDTIVNDAIQLDEVMIMPKLEFDNKNDYRSYIILQRKTRKVWPFAVLASKRLDSLKSRLEKIDSKSKKRRYTKMVQEYMEGKFKERLKKLTHTEGQILVKLMHRQIGMTTFELLKDLKSGWNAFWYQTTAKLFEISLKEEYQPAKNKRDFIIEDILRRSFENDILEEQEPAFDINFSELVDIWGNRIQFYE